MNDGLFEVTLIVQPKNPLEMQEIIRDVMSTYDEDYRSLLEELVPGIPATSIICPPFHCDHGDGIRLGEHVFVNANCTFLDGGYITIGAHTLVGPCVLPIIRWIISSVVRKRNMPIR